MKRSIDSILNQTNFTPREGVFDLSVFPLDNEFEVKIGKKKGQILLDIPVPPTLGLNMDWYFGIHFDSDSRGPLVIIY